MQYNNGQSFHGMIEELLVPNTVSILVVTGQAGAGKTNHVAPLVIAEARSRGYFSDRLGLDAFFFLSSRARKAWLAEGQEIGGEEAQRRNNQISWWDFAKAEASLETLSQGKPLHLEGVYNRADGGELTGEVHIDPSASTNGALIVFDGVAGVHLQHVHKRMFVYADGPVRKKRLKDRDPHRQGKEVDRRFELTEAFEKWYFAQYWDLIDLLVGNNIDNPRPLHLVDFDTAFSDEHRLAFVEHTATDPEPY